MIIKLESFKKFHFQSKETLFNSSINLKSIQVVLHSHHHHFFFFFFSFIFLVNLCTIGYSTSVGWIGIQLLLYGTNNSPLPSGRVHTHEIGWIASILGIGGLVGTVAGGWMADRFGRKYSILALVFPEVVSIYIESHAWISFFFSKINFDWIFFFVFPFLFICLHRRAICWSFLHKMYIICMSHDFFRVSPVGLYSLSYHWWWPRLQKIAFVAL